MEYQILLVAENRAQRHRYAEALIAAAPAGATYKITTTGSAAGAQLQAARQPFHLVVVAAHPGGEGPALAARLRELHADLRLLLVGAALADGAAVGARVVERGSKEALCRAVAEELGLVRPTARPPAVTTPTRQLPATLADVELLLDVARRQAHAQAGFYAGAGGDIVAQCGDAPGLELPALAALLAGGLASAVALGRQLRDPETAQLSVHEGAHFDVYSTNVGGSHLFGLVFDRQVAQPRLAMVWLLMKRASEQLRRMCVAEPPADAGGAAEVRAPLGDELNYAA